MQLSHTSMIVVGVFSLNDNDRVFRFGSGARGWRARRRSWLLLDRLGGQKRRTEIGAREYAGGESIPALGVADRAFDRVVEQ